MQEPEASAHLLQNLFSDCLLVRSQLESVKKLPLLLDAHPANRAQVLAGHLYLERLFPQPPSLALRTQGVATVTAQEYTHVEFVFLAFEVAEKPLDPGTTPQPLVPFLISFPDKLLLFLSQLKKGDVQTHAPCAGRLLEIRIEVAVAGLGPRNHGSLVERQCGVRHNQLGVEVDGIAESLAAGTSAIGAVEGKQPRFRLLIADAARLALEPLVEGQVAPRQVGHFHHGLAAFPVTDLQAVDQPLPGFGLQD